MTEMENGILDGAEPGGKYVPTITAMDIAGLQSFYGPPGSFSGNYQRSSYFCLTGQDCRVADLDNDGFSDLVAFTKTGPVWVAYGTGGNFDGNYQRSPYFCLNNENCQVADIDNDQKPDLISFTKTGPVWVAYGTGRGNFDGNYQRASYFCVNNEDCHVADVDNDKRADLISFSKTGPVYVAYATANRGNFSGNFQRATYFCVGNETCRVGDLNNDGRADIISFTPAGEVWVSYATASGFNGNYKGTVTNTNYRVQTNFCTTGEACEVADVNGDGWADLVVFVKNAISAKQDDVWVSLALPDGTFATPEKWSDYFCAGSQTCALGRFDNNASMDVIAFTGTGPTWVAYAQP